MSASLVSSRSFAITGSTNDVMRIATPLILMTVGHAIKTFSDRIMLGWYSGKAFEAAFIGGVASFTFICLYVGIASYTTTFVSQYYGANNHKRIGLVIWQGFLISFVSSILLACISLPLIRPIFSYTQNDAELTELSLAYFDILIFGAFFTLMNNVFGGFWIGRAKSSVVAIVTIGSILFNLLLNWFVIYGRDGCFEFTIRYEESVGIYANWISIYSQNGHSSFFESSGDIVGFVSSYIWLAGTYLQDVLNKMARWLDIPSFGIHGAAASTVGTECLSMLVFVFLFFRKSMRIKFGTLPKLKFDFDLLKRMIRYGLPNGVQLFLDISSFFIFTLILYSYQQSIDDPGSVRTATTIAFSVNNLAFLPIIGLGIAVSTLVGNAIGRQNIKMAVRSVKNSGRVMLIYATIVSGVLLLFPESIVQIFIRSEELYRHETLLKSADFLRFIGVWLIFDCIFILYSHAIKGAGDTKFVLCVMMITPWVFMVLPCILLRYYNVSYYFCWAAFVIYIMFTALCFYIRYRLGKWKKMRVIEDDLIHT